MAIDTTRPFARVFSTTASTKPLGATLYGALGRPGLPVLQRRDRLPVGIKERIRTGRVAVGRDRIHQPTTRADLDVFDHGLKVLGRPLARHDAENQSALGIDRNVVPGISLAVVVGVERVAFFLLLGDEGPLRVELDFTGVRGKKPRVRRAIRECALRPIGSNGRPCCGPPGRADPADERRNPRRCVRGPTGPCRAADGNRTEGFPCARRSGTCRHGNGASAGSCRARTGYSLASESSTLYLYRIFSVSLWFNLPPSPRSRVAEPDAQASELLSLYSSVFLLGRRLAAHGAAADGHSLGQGAAGHAESARDQLVAEFAVDREAVGINPHRDGRAFGGHAVDGA